MNDEGREPSCEIQVASGALVGVTRGPRLVRRAFAAFGAAAFAAGFAGTGAFAAGAGADFRTSATLEAGAATDFFTAVFAAATGFFAWAAAFAGFTSAFFAGAAARLGAAFEAGFVAFAGFFGAGFAGFRSFFAAGFTAFFEAGFTAFEGALTFFGATFAGFETAFGRFCATAFFATGFAGAFFVTGFNFLTILDLVAELLLEDFIRAVALDVLLFARAIVDSLKNEITLLFGAFWAGALYQPIA